MKPFSMYRNTLCCFLICVLVFSCQSVEKPEKPDPFLSKEEMLPLLIDIAIVKSGKDFDLNKIKENGITPSDYIFKKHGIDSTVYQKNNAWYAANPKLYNELFKLVKDTLTVKKELLEKELLVQDSIRSLTDSTAVYKKNEEQLPIGMRNRKALSKQQIDEIKKIEK